MSNLSKNQDKHLDTICDMAGRAPAGCESTKNPCASKRHIDLAKIGQADSSSDDLLQRTTQDRPTSLHNPLKRL